MIRYGYAIAVRFKMNEEAGVLGRGIGPFDCFGTFDERLRACVSTV